jgi:hypothetical protein
MKERWACRVYMSEIVMAVETARANECTRPDAG